LPPPEVAKGRDLTAEGAHGIVVQELEVIVRMISGLIRRADRKSD